MSSHGSRIAMPLRRRLQYLLGGIGPVTAWVAAALLAGSLVTQKSKYINAPGLAQQQHAVLSSNTAGKILAVSPKLLDQTSEGDIVAVLDDREIRAELEVLRSEATLLQSRTAVEIDRLSVDKAEGERERLIAYRRLAVDFNDAQLAVLDRRVDLETARIELQRLRSEEARLSALTKQGAVSPSELEVIAFRVTESQVFIEETEKTLVEAEGQLGQARKRLEEYHGADGLPCQDQALLVASLEAEGKVISSRIAQVESRVVDLVLRSPLNGSVVDVHTQPGAQVVPGAPIAEVATTTTDVVIAWLPQDSNVRPRRGDEVIIRIGSRKGEVLQGKVSEVSATVLPLPPMLLRAPQYPEYGFPIRIQLLGDSIPSGERVNVRFSAPQS